MWTCKKGSSEKAMEKLLSKYSHLPSLLRVVSPITVTVLFCFAGLFTLIIHFYSDQSELIKREIITEFKMDSLAMKRQFESIVFKSQVVLANIHEQVMLMVDKHTSPSELTKFYKRRGDLFRKKLPLDFSILYSCVYGEYVDDGSWTPPAGYNTKLRPWYTYAVAGKGDVVVVPPYLDPATNEVVISVAQVLKDNKTVIAIDSYFKNFNLFHYDKPDITKHFLVDHSHKVFLCNSKGELVARDELGEQIELIIGKYLLPQNIPSEVIIKGDVYSLIYDKYPQGWGSICLIRHKGVRDVAFSRLTSDLITFSAIGLAIIAILLFSFYYFNEQQKKLKSAIQSKNVFFSMVSHEIRTPLNAIVGFAQLLGGSKINDDEREEYLRYVLEGSNSLTQIVNDILELAKADGFKKKRLEYCDFIQIINGIFYVFAVKADENKDSLELDIPDDLPLMKLDQARIKQVLLNLIGNAVSFTNNGKIIVSVSFTPEGNNTGTLKFSISDTGVGMSSYMVEQIKKPFERNSDFYHNLDGVGLGIPVCDKLIREMNGSFDVASVLGKGTTFTINLKKVVYTFTGSVVNNDSPVKNREVIVESGKTFKFLLCDDAPMNTKVLATILEKFHPVKCVCVNSGKDALSALEREKFDAVITDMWMPEMNGYELARTIRRGNVVPDIPIFCITADVDVDKYFPVDYFASVILKPVTIDKLQDILIKLAK